MPSPTKQPDLNPEKWMQMLMHLSGQNSQSIPQMAQVQMPQMTQIPQVQQMPQVPVAIQTSPGHESQGDQMLKASPSASSEMSSDGLDVSAEQYVNVNVGKPLQSIDSQANIAANE